MTFILIKTIQVRARTSAGYGPDSSLLDMSNIGSGTVIDAGIFLIYLTIKT